MKKLIFIYLLSVITSLFITCVMVDNSLKIQSRNTEFLIKYNANKERINNATTLSEYEHAIAERDTIIKTYIGK